LKGKTSEKGKREGIIRVGVYDFSWVTWGRIKRRGGDSMVPTTNKSKRGKKFRLKRKERGRSFPKGPARRVCRGGVVWKGGKGKEDAFQARRQSLQPRGPRMTGRKKKKKKKGDAITEEEGGGGGRDPYRSAKRGKWACHTYGKQKGKKKRA